MQALWRQAVPLARAARTRRQLLPPEGMIAAWETFAYRSISSDCRHIHVYDAQVGVTSGPVMQQMKR
jgi:hypothetical protein